jgi:RND family efflux transporter MFP subunit
MKAPVILLALTALVLAGCGGEPSRKSEAASAAPVAVETATVTTAAFADGYEASGTVRARTTAVISAKVMGYVREVAAQSGDHVREGQRLVTLDARDLEANYQRADAGLSEARAAMHEVDSAIAGAQAQLDLAQATFKRMQELFDKKSISNQEYDEASARLKAAEAVHAGALSKRVQLQARIDQAGQELNAAGIMRGYATISAPFAGVVTAKSVEPGNLATPGAPLLTVEREGAYRLEVPVEESRLASIHAGQGVNVSLDALDRVIPARVGEIVPAVDAASRTYTVKIDLPALAQLRSGVYGRAVFAGGARQALTVPAEAVIERGQLQSVMVAEGGIARTRLVTLGRCQNGRVEVLSGLNTAEKVISPALPALADGASVEVRP